MRITGSPDALFAPNTPGAFGGLGLSAGDLPGDWANYTASEKIAYFNENAIGAGELIAAGVSQSDIDWMQSHGYTGQPAAQQPLTVPAAVTLPAGVEYAQEQAQAQQTQTVIVGGVTLPSDWTSYTPEQKITFFNENSIGTNALMNVGVSAEDIAWMKSNGYTGEPAAVTQQKKAMEEAAKAAAIKAAADAAAAAAAAKAAAVKAATDAAAAAAAAATKAKQTQTEVKMADYVFTLPAGWENYTPAQKITYFNQNSITPEVLIAEGVTAEDIAWMKTQGYTGKPKAITSTTQTTSATGSAVPLILAAAAAYFFGG